MGKIQNNKTEVKTEAQSPETFVTLLWHAILRCTTPLARCRYPTEINLTDELHKIYFRLELSARIGSTFM